MEEAKFCSIIITNFSVSGERNETFIRSLESLWSNTTYPYELIVVDNGGSDKTSQWLLGKTHSGRIHSYIRNTNNMHFGYARNQGFALSNGQYICIADNDILYKSGWLEACIRVLDAFPNEKVYAAPLYNVAHYLDKYWNGRSLKVGEDEYKLNSRAGSNCFVMRRSDYEEVGRFRCHRVAGTKWTEKAIKLGYMAAVTPKLMVEDMGFRKGYNYKECLPIKINLLGTKKDIYFNQDEFKRENRFLTYIPQLCGNNDVYEETYDKD